MSAEKNFWYIFAESAELKKDKPLKRKILGENLVGFRDKNGKAIILLDYCLHRSGKLSEGWIENGCLVCPFHGWKYNNEAKVCRIPAEGNESKLLKKDLKAKKFLVEEKQGYIYVCLSEQVLPQNKPFDYPYYQNTNWATVRFKNLFENNVINCVENFIDVPHTVFVHTGIFRSEKGQKIEAIIESKNGKVYINYQNENSISNFNWFFNSSKQQIKHTDIFITPNITNVNYKVLNNCQYIITSQSVPVDEWQTMVYTDISYNFGLLTQIAKPIVQNQAEQVLRQDLKILKEQAENIKQFKKKFIDTEADLIHTLISELRDKTIAGENISELPEIKTKISFYI